MIRALKVSFGPYKLAFSLSGNILFCAIFFHQFLKMIAD